MDESELHPSLMLCYAYVEGVSEGKIRNLVSAKALPANGNSYRALCKWPRQTARGYDDRGDFRWATVVRKDDEVFISPLKEQGSIPLATYYEFSFTELILLALWFVFWAVAIGVAQSRYQAWIGSGA